MVGEATPLQDAFLLADDVLRQVSSLCQHLICLLMHPVTISSRATLE